MFKNEYISSSLVQYEQYYKTNNLGSKWTQIK